MEKDVPSQNIEAHQILYRLEVGLREMIIEVLSEAAGPRWHITRLPSDVLATFKEGRASEREQKSVRSISYHPIYYTDFPDLKKIIQKSDNWKDFFRQVFGANLRELLAAELQAIEGIRNKVAHNRIIALHELDMLRILLERFEVCVGKSRFENYLRRSTLYSPKFSRFEVLANELASVTEAMLAIQEVDKPGSWDEVTSAWWFDEEYIGEPLTDVCQFGRLVDEYVGLPRVRGCGPAIAKWTIERRVAEAGRAAVERCRKIALLAKDEVSKT